MICFDLNIFLYEFNKHTVIKTFQDASIYSAPNFSGTLVKIATNAIFLWHQGVYYVFAYHCKLISYKRLIQMVLMLLINTPIYRPKYFYCLFLNNLAVYKKMRHAVLY